MLTTNEPTTRIEGPYRRSEAPAPDSDPLYRRALHNAGCRVVDTATGWVAVSPAGLAMFARKDAQQHGS